MGILYNPLLCLAQQQVTLNVIPGATNMSYDFYTVPGILNYLYGCRSRLGLNFSDSEHTTKISVSAVKNNFMIILSFIVNVLEINTVLILQGVTSQELFITNFPSFATKESWFCVSNAVHYNCYKQLTIYPSFGNEGQKRKLSLFLS